MTTTIKQYYAFISYKRDDQKWAEWLHELIARPESVSKTVR